MAFQSAQLRAQNSIQRLNEKLKEREAEAARLDQLRVRLEAGEEVDMTPTVAKKVRRVAGFGVKKPRLSKEEHHLIMELAGSKTQTEIAEQVGSSQPTVSRHINKQPNAGPGRRGRKPVMTPDMVNAAARFQFLFNTRSWRDASQFINNNNKCLDYRN